MAKAELLPVKTRKRLEELEADIERTLTQAFVAAGTALQAIRDEVVTERDGVGHRLYEEAGFATFEEYVVARWQMRRAHAYRLIDAAQVYELLSPMGDILPANERVARELTPLLDKPKLLAKAWRQAVRTAEKCDGRPIVTAQHVKDVVREYRHETHEVGEFSQKGYRIVYADPPWSYGDELIKGYGAASHHYPQMTIDELCSMTDARGRSVVDIVADNAVLFIWAPSPLLLECFSVIHAWGFDYKASFVWDKQLHNFGHYNSVRHELLLIATRGSCTPDSKELHDSVVSIKRSSKHSEKPEEFRQIIDEMYPPRAGKRRDRIELFARTKAKDWDSYGNQSG